MAEVPSGPLPSGMRVLRAVALPLRSIDATGAIPELDTPATAS